MQDFFSQEDFVDDFKSKQINAIFFSNKSHNDSLDNTDVLYDNDEYLYKQDNSNSFNTGSTLSDKVKVHRKQIPLEKKKLIQEKNRESARQSRRRKKQIIEGLLKENRELKRELQEYKNYLFVTLCKDCKAKLNIIPNNNQVIQQCNNVPQIQSRKTVSLFTVCAAVICIILNIGYFFDFFSLPSSSSILRQLSNNKKFTYEQIEKINVTVGRIFISYGDYYSISNGKQFFNNEVLYTFENKGKVRKLYKEEVGQLPVAECPSCMVEIPKENIVQKKGKVGFKLFVNQFSPIGINSNNDTVDKNFTLIELDCETTGFSRHMMKVRFDNMVQ